MLVSVDRARLTTLEASPFQGVGKGAANPGRDGGGNSGPPECRTIRRIYALQRRYSRSQSPGAGAWKTPPGGACRAGSRRHVACTRLSPPSAQAQWKAPCRPASQAKVEPLEVGVRRGHFLPSPLSPPTYAPAAPRSAYARGASS
eukprot:365478-Chlamydomonas_euryale.AAC.15